MLKKTNLIALSITALAFFVVLLPQSAKAEPYYQGKTITVLVGMAPGGGTDTTARVLAQHFGKHIAGNPNVIVKNMPGAGGNIATNLIAEKTRPDGLTIIFQDWSPVSQLINEPGVRFDYNELTMIGASQGPPIMVFARTDAVPGGVKTPTDIVKAEKLICAGLSPTVSLDLFGRLSLDLLGVSYKYVSGFKGATLIRAAIAQNEAQLAIHAMNGYKSGVEPTMGKDGTVTPLWYFQQKGSGGQYVKDPDVSADMLDFMEVYMRVHGKPPTGELWNAFELVRELYATGSWFFWGPPKMNSDATGALRDGFYKMMVDKALIADMRKATDSTFIPVSIDSMRAVVAAMSNADPSIINFLKDYVESGR